MAGVITSSFSDIDHIVDESSLSRHHSATKVSESGNFTPRTASKTGTPHRRASRPKEIQEFSNANYRPSSAGDQTGYGTPKSRTNSILNKIRAESARGSKSNSKSGSKTNLSDNKAVNSEIHNDETTYNDDFETEADNNTQVAASSTEAPPADTMNKSESSAESNEDAAKAAMKIQSSFRGFKARKEVKALREEETAAVTKIQSSFRGFKARKEFNKSKIEKRSLCEEEELDGSQYPENNRNSNGNQENEENENNPKIMLYEDRIPDHDKNEISTEPTGPADHDDNKTKDLNLNEYVENPIGIPDGQNKQPSSISLNSNSTLPPIGTPNKSRVSVNESMNDQHNITPSLENASSSIKSSSPKKRPLSSKSFRQQVKLSGFEFRRDPVVEALAEHLIDQRRQEMEQLNRLILLRLTNPWSAVTNSEILFSGLAWESVQRHYKTMQPVEQKKKVKNTPPQPPKKTEPTRRDLYFAKLATPRTKAPFQPLPPGVERIYSKAGPPNWERIERLAQPRNPKPIEEEIYSIHSKPKPMDPVVFARLTKPRVRVDETENVVKKVIQRPRPKSAKNQSSAAKGDMSEDEADEYSHIIEKPAKNTKSVQGSKQKDSNSNKTKSKPATPSTVSKKPKKNESDLAAIDISGDTIHEDGNGNNQKSKNVESARNSEASAVSASTIVDSKDADTKNQDTSALDKTVSKSNKSLRQSQSLSAIPPAPTSLAEKSSPRTMSESQIPSSVKISQSIFSRGGSIPSAAPSSKKASVNNVNDVPLENQIVSSDHQTEEDIPAEHISPDLESRPSAIETDNYPAENVPDDHVNVEETETNQYENQIAQDNEILDEMPLESKDQDEAKIEKVVSEGEVIEELPINQMENQMDNHDKIVSQEAAEEIIVDETDMNN